jgi:transposase
MLMMMSPIQGAINYGRKDKQIASALGLKWRLLGLAICFSPHLYRARNLVERFFNKIKHCRRVATRYDKLAANYLAFVQLASFRLWLRANESAS